MVCSIRNSVLLVSVIRRMRYCALYRPFLYRREGGAVARGILIKMTEIATTGVKRDRCLCSTFSTYDEERYHEPLVHPALFLVQARKDVLVLGGGDGLAVREILKYPDVESVTLVDLDPAITHLAQTHEIFLKVDYFPKKS